MDGKGISGAIVGASALLGKELSDELNESQTVTWDLRLFDAESSGGTITSAGDEALVIQPVSRDSFSGIDVVFFAGEPSTALEYWKPARAAGASIVDLTGALTAQPGLLVRSPLIEGGVRPDLTTPAEEAAHPAAVMLAMAATKLLPLGMRRMAVTILQPASQAGNAGVEELHKQTVGLLSFQPLKKEIYDAQVAFNLTAALGETSTVDLQKAAQKIQKQIAAIAPSLPEDTLSLQLLQAPVFHGYTASVFIELADEVNAETVRKALSAGQSPLQEDESPSNETAAGKGEVLFRIAPGFVTAGKTFWLFLAADNLRLAARNAAACALELTQLRPVSGIQ
ncbi:MAG: Asd/ArgC dimerization domain-containing protein [Acidobacteriaceae bacterium]